MGDTMRAHPKRDGMGSRSLKWTGIALGVWLVARPEAHALSPVRRPESPDSTQFVGNGVYPATTSNCYSAPVLWPDIRMQSNSGTVMTAPTVVGVYWPAPSGGPGTDPQVRALFGDFVTDLFNGPYWNATMPQYVGTAHGNYQSSVDITTLLTLTPSATVDRNTIAPELVAQVQAGVLPAYAAGGNTIYVVHFPPGVTIIDPGGIGESCVQFCAYHDFYVVNFQLAFTFSVHPDFTQNATCASGCGLGTVFDRYMQTLSHELFETVTDPWLPNGWENDCTGGQEEVADVCDESKFFVPRRTSSSGSPQCPNRWPMSSIFSNAAYVSPPNGCVVSDSTAVPDLTISLSHTGNFAQGQIGDHYKITVGNATAGTTCGPVTVTESVPAGLTLTGLSGSGWTCGGTTCTRSDTLLANASYPDITATVTVAPNAPASVTNSASVSGGDELNAANDSASDPTTVAPGSAAGCNDSNVCTADAFNPATGCVYTNAPGPCDDANACTTGDSCAAGICTGTPVAAPPEVQSVTVAADKATYNWSAAASATRYDVVRGSTGAFPVGPGGGDEVCFDNLPGTTLNDPAVPAVGTGFWYLSRGESACGNGTWGNATSGPRVTTTCP